MVYDKKLGKMRYTLKEMFDCFLCPCGNKQLHGETEYGCVGGRFVVENRCGRHDITDQMPEAMKSQITTPPPNSK